MTIVVDLGCFTHPTHPHHNSVAELTRRYQPDELYGFDPYPDMLRVEVTDDAGRYMLLRRLAAWTFDGEIPYDPSPGTPMSAKVGEGPMRVPCFDLARFLGDLPRAGREVVVKMDVESAEYRLLEHLLATDTIGAVDVLLVEWHPVEGWEERRDTILADVPCEVLPWD